MFTNYRRIKLVWTAKRWRQETENLSSGGYDVHTTAKEVISRRRKDENDLEM